MTRRSSLLCLSCAASICAGFPLHSSKPIDIHYQQLQQQSRLTECDATNSIHGEFENTRTRISAAVFLHMAPMLLVASTYFLSEHKYYAYAMDVPANTVYPGSSTSTLPKTSSSYKLVDSNAFRSLPREPRLSRPAKELRDLKELQDSRLDVCAERGTFWEQCFMFGQSVGGGGIDENINNGMGSSQQSTNDGLKQTRRGTIPTW